MNMKFVRNFSWAIGIFLVGCAPIKVQTFVDPYRAVSDLHTWTFSPGAGACFCAEGVSGTYRMKRLKEEFLSQLGNHGYTFVKGQEADMYLNYRCMVDRKIVQKVFINPADVERGGVKTSQAECEFKEGQLTAYMLDKTSNILWQGNAQVRISQTNSKEDIRSRVHQVVHALLENFPVRLEGKD